MKCQSKKETPRCSLQTRRKKEVKSGEFWQLNAHSSRSSSSNSSPMAAQDLPMDSTTLKPPPHWSDPWHGQQQFDRFDPRGAAKHPLKLITWNIGGVAGLRHTCIRLEDLSSFTQLRWLTNRFGIWGPGPWLWLVVISSGTFLVVCAA